MLVPQSPTGPPVSSDAALPAARGMVLLVVALFFLWGAITSLNDVLIPKLKGLFALSFTQAMLTQFAFFTGYLVFSLPAGALVARAGYMRSIVIGLALMAAGCLLFLPAVHAGAYAGFLAALFVLSGGITVLQVAANPLIASLGPAETSHSRLTLAQAFNSLGTTIAPPLGAQIILGSVATTDPSRLSAPERAAFLLRESAIVGHTYLGIAAFLALLALIFWAARRNLADRGEETVPLGGALALLRRPRLAFGVAALFLYVGAEVTIGSLLVNYLEQPRTLGLDPRAAGEHLAFYWGGAMIGRFVGAYALRRFSPGRALATAALAAAALAAVSMLSGGGLAAWTLLAVGLANAIMFPTIFGLALEGLGARAPQGSSLLCMAIVGGALVPLLAGRIADAAGLAAALAVPILCYLAIAGFGWAAREPATD